MNLSGQTLSQSASAPLRHLSRCLRHAVSTLHDKSVGVCLTSHCNSILSDNHVVTDQLARESTDDTAHLHIVTD